MPNEVEGGTAAPVAAPEPQAGVSGDRRTGTGGSGVGRGLADRGLADRGLADRGLADRGLADRSSAGRAQDGGPTTARGGHPASRRGEAGLAQVDREVAARFAQKYESLASAPVAVVVAAYNEEATVGHVVKDTPAEVAGLPVEVIVVVDGSRDATAAVAEESGALVADVPVNRGQGAALRLGYHLARQRGARFVITTDADGQWRAADMERVLAPLLAGEADFVNGSRRLGSTANRDPVRNVGVVVFAALISLLTGRRVTDPASGLRAMTAELTGSVVLDQPQYQSSELLISAAMGGFRIAEVPIDMQARRSGHTKKGGNLVYGWRFSKVVVTTWLRERRVPRSTNTNRS